MDVTLAQKDDLKILYDSIEDKFVCQICSYKTTQKGNVKLHINIIHNKVKTFNCQEKDCTEIFAYNASMKSHMISIHNGNKYACDNCEYESSISANLKRHQAGVHANEKQFRCEECGKYFNQKRNMIEHNSTEHKKEKYKCDVKKCEKEFWSKSSLTRHAISHADMQSVLTNNCDKCSFTTKEKSTLKRHISIIHLKEKLFQCTECKYVATQNGNLKKHKIAKHSEKKHKNSVHSELIANID